MPAPFLFVLLVFSGNPQALAQPALQPLGFLVGSCWSGQQPKGTVDTHCFSTVYGGQFVRDVHEVTGGARPYAGETLYHWDGRQKQVRFTYYNSLGGVSTGSMSPEDGALVFPEVHESRDGRKVEMRSVWRPDGAESYVATTEVRTENGWREESRVVFRRRTNLRPGDRERIR